MRPIAAHFLALCDGWQKTDPRINYIADTVQRINRAIQRLLIADNTLECACCTQGVHLRDKLDCRYGRCDGIVYSIMLADALTRIGRIVVR